MKKYLFVILLALIAMSFPYVSWGAFISYPQFQVFDDDSVMLSGGLVYTYEVGGTTDKTTYSDAAMTLANENPVELDTRGEADIYCSGLVKLVITTSAGVAVITQDNFSGRDDTLLQDADGDTLVQVEESADEDIIRFDAGGTEQVIIQDGSIVPTTNDDIIIGSEAKKFKEVKTLKLSGDPFPGFIVRPKFTYVESLDYTSGGTHELVVGDTVEGATGGGTGYVAHITLTGGAWADGDAAGVIYLHTRNATAFEAEVLKDNGNVDCASIAAASSKNAILISPFVYYHNGTTEQLLYSDANIPFEFANLGTSDWSYLYFDDSAIVTAATNLITATQLVDAVAEPAYSAAKHGRYHVTTLTDDMCFFAVLTDGADNILEFFHDGGKSVTHANHIVQDTGTAYGTTWTDEDLTGKIPSFSTKALAFFRTTYGDNNAHCCWRINGQTGSDGHDVTYVEAGVTKSVNTVPIMTDSNQIVELRLDSAGSSTSLLHINGWYFPQGL